MSPPPERLSTALAKLPCLSIRQPWAHMILYCGKDIENRTWHTRFRGEFLIHAAKGMTLNEWDEAVNFQKLIGARSTTDPVTHKTILRGGIVGVARMVDCVAEHKSPWFFGDYGFVLEDVRPLEFFPCKGSLGFFKLPALPIRTIQFTDPSRVEGVMGQVNQEWGGVFERLEDER